MADKKISELTGSGAHSGTDIVPVVQGSSTTKTTLSAIKTWLDANLNVTLSMLGGDITTAGKALLDDADAAAQRTTLGLGTASTSAYASRPAASNDGNLFLPSDSFYVQRDTGAAWASWGPIYPMTPPIPGDFAWVNQGGATIDTTYGGIYLEATATSGGNIRIRKKAAPTPPYTITVGMLPLLPPTAATGSVGLCWRQASDGKLIPIGPQITTTSASAFRVTHWTNPTTFSSLELDLNAASLRYGAVLWLQLIDDNTNRKVRWSMDRRHWIELYSATRTTFLTADEVGFFADSENTTYPVGITILSWEES